MNKRCAVTSSDEARKAYRDILFKHSPPQDEPEQKRSWAEEVEAVLHDKHHGDHKLIKKHLMSIVSGLNHNAEHLHKFAPMEIVSMNLSELNQGTAAATTRALVANGLLGWESCLEKPIPTLPKDSEWYREGSGCRLVIVSFQNKEVNDAFAQLFHSTERVEVIDGSILHQDGGGFQADALMAPANTIGNMDGGIDRIYANHFKWPFGRPYKDLNPLQEEIDAKYGQFKQLPIGDALLVPVTYKEIHDVNVRYAQEAEIEVTPSVRYLIAAPTMVRPEEIEKGSSVVYQAALAAFRVWRDCAVSHRIYCVATPSFGTGVGNVPPIIAARQMWAAFVDAWSPE